ncbi:MAG: MFS transporter [Actinomycetota bacterium]
MHKSHTASYFAAFIALGLVAASLGPTLPGLAEQTHTRLSAISYLFTARSFGYLVGSYLGGRAYDRYPGHPLLGATLLLMAGAMALVPVIPLLWVVTFTLFVLGLGESFLDVGCNTLLVWIHREKVGPFLNGLHFFFGVGTFLSPIIVAQAILWSGSIAWAYWGMAILIAPVAFWLLRLSSPSAPQSTLENPTMPAHPGLIWLLAAVFFVYVGMEVSFGGWVYTYALSTRLASETSAAYLTSGFWGAFTVGRLLSVPFSARFTPRVLLRADLAGMFAGLALLLLFPSSLAALWAATLLIGLSMASIFPTLLAFAGRRMTLTARITGWFFMGVGLGAMFFPWLIGQLFEPLGPQALGWVLLAAVVLAFGMYGAVLKVRPWPVVHAV